MCQTRWVWQFTSTKFGGMTGTFRFFHPVYSMWSLQQKTKPVQKLWTFVAAFNSSMWWSRRQRSGIFGGLRMLYNVVYVYMYIHMCIYIYTAIYIYNYTHIFRYVLTTVGVLKRLKLKIFKVWSCDVAKWWKRSWTLRLITNSSWIFTEMRLASDHLSMAQCLGMKKWLLLSQAIHQSCTWIDLSRSLKVFV